MTLKPEFFQSFCLRICPGLLVLVFINLAAVMCPAQGGGSTSSRSTSLARYVPTMTFDVASVREARPDPGKGFMVGGGFAGNSSALALTNVGIGELLELAYDVSRHEVSGHSNWTSAAMYDIEAKSDEKMDKELAGLPTDWVAMEHQHMMQALLADRFKLKVHWETRKQRVLSLVVAKNGTKMQVGGSSPPSVDELKRFGNQKIPEIQQYGDGALGYQFIGHDARIAQLAVVLGSLIQTDVNDATGLTGTYDFDLRYSQADDARREANPKIWPPIQEAIKEQLGLKLVNATREVNMLVVDHIERPSPN